MKLLLFINCSYWLHITKLCKHIIFLTIYKIYILCNNLCHFCEVSRLFYFALGGKCKGENDKRLSKINNYKLTTNILYLNEKHYIFIVQNIDLFFTDFVYFSFCFGGKVQGWNWYGQVKWSKQQTLANVVWMQILYNYLYHLYCSCLLKCYKI